MIGFYIIHICSRIKQQFAVNSYMRLMFSEPTKRGAKDIEVLIIEYAFCTSLNIIMDRTYITKTGERKTYYFPSCDLYWLTRHSDHQHKVERGLSWQIVPLDLV